MKTIDKEAAKELIDEADHGYLVLENIDPVPTIGDVAPEATKVDVEVDILEFE